MKLLHDTPDTLNRPQKILGVEKVTFGMLIPISYVLGKILARWVHFPLLGIGAFVLLAFGAQFLFKHEEKFWSIYFQVIRFKKVFDPIRREHFKFTIEED